MGGGGLRSGLYRTTRQARSGPWGFAGTLWRIVRCGSSLPAAIRNQGTKPYRLKQPLDFSRVEAIQGELAWDRSRNTPRSCSSERGQLFTPAENHVTPGIAFFFLCL